MIYAVFCVIVGLGLEDSHAPSFGYPKSISEHHEPNAVTGGAHLEQLIEEFRLQPSRPSSILVLEIYGVGSQTCGSHMLVLNSNMMAIPEVMVCRSLILSVIHGAPNSVFPEILSGMPSILKSISGRLPSNTDACTGHCVGPCAAAALAEF